MSEVEHDMVTQNDEDLAKEKESVEKRDESLAANEKIETNDEDNWTAECSDEESYHIEPADIKQLYERISRREQMTLEWKLVGRRRSPTPTQGDDEATKAISESVVVADNTSSAVLPGYEFDEPSSDTRPARQPARRSTGATPRTNQKRVARLDKIMDDMVRHKKMDDEAHVGTIQKSPQRRSSPKT